MCEENGKSFCEALHEKFSSQFDLEEFENIVVQGRYLFIFFNIIIYIINISILLQLLPCKNPAS